MSEAYAIIVHLGLSSNLLQGVSGAPAHILNIAGIINTVVFEYVVDNSIKSIFSVLKCGAKEGTP